MTAYDTNSGSPDMEAMHETVGAYALGILDDAEATAFEAHLAECDFCQVQLEELAGMEPMLAALADMPEQRVPEVGKQLAARPSDKLLTSLVDEVAEKRASKRRRAFYLVAAAAALIIGGPLTVMAVSGGNDGTNTPSAHSTSPAQDAFFHHMDEKVEATDARTDVTATVGLEKKAWGTHTVLELKNVKGPLKCSLIAVDKNGKEETVTSWSVPKWGYGIEDSPNKWARNPLYVHGGAAMDRGDIDHFEVRTFDGKRLVEVKA
ncbi:zf-HC2 domain-containing protein [Streptomyces sp. T-3]|nr:zf-HC2 domain-containing protein [Streptomyces sp. T-3]